MAQVGDIFPEITKKQDDLKRILDEEELSFARTLDRGEGLFEKYLAEAKSVNLKTLDGAFVWRLYDTYGFPTDLTRLMAQEDDMDIDEKGFEEAQLKPRKSVNSERKGKVARNYLS
jgi:alanyl-tRNA synthetase